MRSIGKRNIELVKSETRRALAEQRNITIEDLVISRLPDSLWDIWESADAEIRRIIFDEIFKGDDRDR